MHDDVCALHSCLPHWLGGFLESLQNAETVIEVAYLLDELKVGLDCVGAEKELVHQSKLGLHALHDLLRVDDDRNIKLLSHPFKRLSLFFIIEAFFSFLLIEHGLYEFGSGFLLLVDELPQLALVLVCNEVRHIGSCLALPCELKLSHDSLVELQRDNLRESQPLFLGRLRLLTFHLGSPEKLDR